MIKRHFIANLNRVSKLGYLVPGLCLLSLVGFTSAFAQDGKGSRLPTLPGGASSLTETFEDWTVACAVSDGKTSCVVWQSQVREDGQRMLDVRIAPIAQAGGTNATLTFPLGLELARGVMLQAGENGKPISFPFKTCLTVGCVVPMVLDAAMMEALKSNIAFKVAAASLDNKEVPFSVSLKGFGAAIDRSIALVSGK